MVDPGDDFVDGGTATSKAALLAKVSASVDLWQDQIDADDPTRNAIAMYVHDIDSHWNPPGSLLAETADNQTPPHMLSVLLWTGDIH